MMTEQESLQSIAHSLEIISTTLSSSGLLKLSVEEIITTQLTSAFISTDSFTSKDAIDSSVNTLAWLKERAWG